MIEIDGDSHGQPDLPLHPPPSSAKSTLSLERAILRRGSSRAFKRFPITLDQFATLLDRSVRPIRTDDRRGAALAAPYLIVNAAEGLEPGVYRVVERDREPRLSMQTIRLGVLRAQAAHLALKLDLAGGAVFNIY